MRLLKYSLLFITFIFTEDFSYKIGKIKLDYNNVEFTFNDRSTTANFNLKKLLLSTSDTDFFIDNNGDNAILHIGPSKLSIQGLVFSFFNHYSQNNFEFNLGNLNFDIYECDFDVIKGRDSTVPTTSRIEYNFLSAGAKLSV